MWNPSLIPENQMLLTRESTEQPDRREESYTVKIKDKKNKKRLENPPFFWAYLGLLGEWWQKVGEHHTLQGRHTEKHIHT